MAITRDTMLLAADMRRAIGEMADAQALELTRAWVDT